MGCQSKEARDDRGDPQGSELLRLLVGPGGELVFEAAVGHGGGGGGRRGRGAGGRGAYLHPRPACLVAAAQRGLARSARAAVSLIPEPEGQRGEPIKLTPEALGEALVVAMDRRMTGLLASAVRIRALAVGADAVKAALRSRDAALVVVACDAAAAAELGEVRAAVAEGRAIAWGTKASLARAVSPTRVREEGIGVVAVCSEGIAAALHAASRARDGGLSVRQGAAELRQPRGRARGGNG